MRGVFLRKTSVTRTLGGLTHSRTAGRRNYRIGIGIGQSTKMACSRLAARAHIAELVAQEQPVHPDPTYLKPSRLHGMTPLHRERVVKYINEVSCASVATCARAGVRCHCAFVPHRIPFIPTSTQCARPDLRHFFPSSPHFFHRDPCAVLLPVGRGLWATGADRGAGVQLL